MYTLLCVLLAALKAVMSGEILTGDLRLHPMDLLLKMCPFALFHIGIMCVLSGEVQEIYSRYKTVPSPSPLPYPRCPTIGQLDWVNCRRAISVTFSCSLGLCPSPSTGRHSWPTKSPALSLSALQRMLNRFILAFYDQHTVSDVCGCLWVCLSV
jgi:hypothetical protein